MSKKSMRDDPRELTKFYINKQNRNYAPAEGRTDSKEQLRRELTHARELHKSLRRDIQAVEQALKAATETKNAFFQRIGELMAIISERNDKIASMEQDIGKLSEYVMVQEYGLPQDKVKRRMRLEIRGNESQ